MINVEPTVKEMAELWNTVAKFITEQHISCPEATNEDWVHENATNLIADMCEIVGYYDYPEDE
jgi:hypothetical protein